MMENTLDDTVANVVVTTMKNLHEHVPNWEQHNCNLNTVQVFK